MKKIRRLIQGKISFLIRGIPFFYFYPQATKDSKSHTYKEIRTLKAFNGLMLPFEYSPTLIAERFAQSNIFCFLEVNHAMVSYGWINASKSHYVGELDLTLQVGNNYEILFDFYTYPNYRNNGYYRLLLNHICDRNNTIKVIYALKKNLNSITGIKNAGFKFQYTVYGFNKNNYTNLLK